MAEQKKRQRQLSYTPDELREILTALYGPGTDWHLAKEASDPYQFNVKTETVLRWLNGSRSVKGTAAGLAYHLSKKVDQ